MNNIHPIAQAVQSQGRGKDTQLVHMTPGEVQGLQSLAKAHGGSLSVNPETGLVEAGFLDSILPVVAGAGLMMVPGMQPIGAAMITGLGATMLNGGDLGAGLMAGLGAYGGAGLAGSLGVGAAAPGTGLTAAAPATLNPTAAANAGMATNPTSYAINSTNAASGINSGLATNSSGLGLTGAPASAQASQFALNPAAVSPYNVTAAPQMSGIAAPATPMPAALPSAATVTPAPTSVMDKLSSGSFYSDNALNIGAAAAPALLAADQPKGSSYVPDDEQYQYDYNPNKTSQAGLDAQRLANPGGELNYFNSTFSDPRRVRINAAQGGEIGYAGGGIFGQAAELFKKHLDAQSSQSSTAEHRYTYDPTNQEYTRVAQGGILSLAEGGMPDEYTYDPATQKYIKKPSVAAAPMAAPMGAVKPIGLDSSGGYEAPMPAEGYKGPGLISMALGNSGQNNAPVVDMSTMSPAAAAQAGYINSSPDVGMGGPSGDSIGADAAAAGAAAEASMGIDDGSDGVYAQGGLMGLAKGGMAKGGFVVPADVVSALGNGSTDAGLRALKSKFGAVKHIKGKGDGLSDSIDTSIDGRQPARVADGEAYIDPRTVASIGKGDSKKGAKKLYAMMDKIRSQAHGKTTQQRKVDSRKVV